MADWLFFREYHLALQITLSELLQDSDEESRVLIVGPNRSNTVNEFIDTLSEGQMFDHSIEPMKEALQNQGEEEKDNHRIKNKASIENINDIKLNSNDPFLMSEPEDQEAGTNALDLDFEDELNFWDDAE